MTAGKKKVALLLPVSAEHQGSDHPHGLEMEVLGRLAELAAVNPGSEDALIAGTKDADALLTSWGFRISRRVIESLTKCVAIGVGSVGVDMVDVDAATEHGIVVTNTPDIFVEEVADHAMMLLLACRRQLKIQESAVQQGAWFSGRPKLGNTPRLPGQTLGLLAYGNVAEATARRARAFGMHIIACDPYISEIRMTRDGVEPVGFQELLQRSDCLSLHCLLNEETRHIMNLAAFQQMKPSACLINTCRGGVVDEAALVTALDTGLIAAAGLDVLEQEPPAPDNPLLGRPNVFITPHVASASSRMRPETRRRAAREVALALEGKWPMSPVNPEVMPRVALARWQPYSMERGPNR